VGGSRGGSAAGSRLAACAPAPPRPQPPKSARICSCRCRMSLRASGCPGGRGRLVARRCSLLPRFADIRWNARAGPDPTASVFAEAIAMDAPRERVPTTCGGDSCDRYNNGGMPSYMDYIYP
jgi:hypothetical protein